MTEQADTAAVHTVYLGLGSNIGDRDANLSAALRALAAVVIVERVSLVYDTAPMLYTNQPRFHNLVCQARTSLSPDALLQAVKEIERQLGRTQGPRYGPRVIDIDVLLYDRLIVNTPALTIPHPRMAERVFVLAPLAELVPSLIHPNLGETIAELLRRAPESDVERVGPLPQS
ncbi:MAG TPA: 2-amino-4-hydroxy-6-hydroxymethyldihydropteridine diphosphokinase [Ktedonobacterales bacterium]|jgi:2-amino-4-hydroxy-6-hydroxymethyldihydropteridine diphosphokinase